MADESTKCGDTVDCTIANSRVRARVPILFLDFSVKMMKIGKESGVLLVGGRNISNRVELRTKKSLVYRVVALN